MKTLLTIVVCLFAGGAFSQQINPELLNGFWKAHWITSPDVPQKDYGVYYFRKKINLAATPARYIVHVSADNRYRLFVNGRPVASGPARGDLYNWYFETVDLAPFFKAGENVVAALVWNMGIHAPVAQISNQTGIVLQGDTEQEAAVNSGSGWRVMADSAYSPCSLDNMQRLQSYMVIGPGDSVHAERYPWGWQENDFDDTKWNTAVVAGRAVPFGFGTDNQWTLVPRTIPPMEEKEQPLYIIRRAVGIKTGERLDRRSPLKIPANSTVSILLDQGFNTIGYPEIVCSGGKSARVKLTYAEALFDKNREKGNRNEVEGKQIIGNYDVFVMDGGSKRQFRPLWLRTWRYLQLDITTDAQELVLDDLHSQFSAYPFEEKAAFESSDPSLKELWNVGWRTARLCAGETYFDCPYYEQLQYEGDTRIQALISLYISGDDRLMRKAITDFYNSRVPEGLTQGRYPSNRLQVIPPYSLFWVSMLYDYWMHRPDPSFVKQYMPAVRNVLEWYEKHIDTSRNMLGPMKWWNFTDYTEKFQEGVPDGADDGNSSVITLHYAYTLRQTAELSEYFGDTHSRDRYQKLTAQIIKGTYKYCYDSAKNLVANTPEKTRFSQHAGIMAVLSGAVPQGELDRTINILLNDTSLIPATFYYRFYLNRALKYAGHANRYYSELVPWRDMIRNGLTTFAEKPEPARSDCHAWSASPCYDFLATICGIEPAAPGFSKVRIAPAPGELTEIKARMPHPDGEIQLQMIRSTDGSVAATIFLPGKLEGSFHWRGKTVKLKAGQQSIKL